MVESNFHYSKRLLNFTWKVRKAKIELDKNLHPEKYV